MALGSRPLPALRGAAEALAAEIGGIAVQADVTDPSGAATLSPARSNWEPRHPRQQRRSPRRADAPDDG